MNATQSTTHNVDPAEVQKFEDLASRWWDRKGEFKALHDINPIRLNYIDSGYPLENNTVLDIGCGGGILSESMAQCGARVTGIDMGQAPLGVAKLHALEQDIEIDYRHCTAEELATTEAGKYDVITCMEMLEHVPDPASVIDACHQLLKPGGSVFFSTINRNPKAYLFAIVGAEYVMKMLPRGTHDYNKFIRPSELDSWARASGFDLLDIAGISFNPLLQIFSQSSDVDVNYMSHYRKPE
jgi:2-polyprenyl-6-hydroxyphenyl methylase/3-demethylubiquinone-9 3-methyltransferase